MGTGRRCRELGRRLARLHVPEPMAADTKAARRPAAGNVHPADRRPVGPEVRPGSGRGVRPFYLATTELSLGQFIDLINATGNWSAANALLGSTPSRRGDGRRRQAARRPRPAAVGPAAGRQRGHRPPGHLAVRGPGRRAAAVPVRAVAPADAVQPVGPGAGVRRQPEVRPPDAASAGPGRGVRGGGRELPAADRPGMAGRARPGAEAGRRPGQARREPPDATWRTQQEFSAREAPTQWPGP
jgi:hypothetical protein